MLTDVYPGAVERVADDGLVLGDEFLNQISGVEEGLFWNLCKRTLLDEVDTCIGIIVILRFLQQSFNVEAFQIQDAEWNADVIWNGCY